MWTSGLSGLFARSSSRVAIASSRSPTERSSTASSTSSHCGSDSGIESLPWDLARRVQPGGRNESSRGLFAPRLVDRRFVRSELERGDLDSLVRVDRVAVGTED